MNKDHKLIITEVSSLSAIRIAAQSGTDEESRGQIALVIENNRLTEVALEDHHSYLDGIYLGKVQNVLPDIRAYFVEIDKGVLCFLRFSEVEAGTPILVNRSYDDRLVVGDEVVVQVTADPIKTKQMTVTTNISMKGRFLVLSMGKPQLGISSKIPKKYRNFLKKGLQEIGIIEENGQTRPIAGFAPTIGCIVRTQVLSQLSVSDTESMTLSQQSASDTESMVLLHQSASDTESMVLSHQSASDTDSLEHPIFASIAAEYQCLKDKMIQLVQNARHRTCYTCLQAPPAYYETVIAGLSKSEQWEIVTDLPTVYTKLEQYLKSYPDEPLTIRQYQDDILPLAKLYSVESKLKEALTKRVWLKSGAYLVIEQTEAMVVIDVNTGKALQKHHHTKPTHDAFYFYQINLEAAKEVAIQLRLRNLSGIIIIDFINMENEELDNKLLLTLKQLVISDPTKTEVVDITSLGLVEITRKRKGRPLNELLIIR
ncbi:MAG: ribonuclease E/G [Clostridium sp.]|nr:ribonuclease E/G [Clostridium sp.]